MIDVVINGTTVASGLLLDAYKLNVKILKLKAEEEEESFIVKNILKTGVSQLKAKTKELKKRLK